MSKISIIEDISNITTIPVADLNKVARKGELCICHRVSEGVAAGESVTNIDVFFGNLLIKVTEEGVRYKFIPSKEFDRAVKNVVDKGEDPLISQLESAVVTTMLKAYKDLF